MKHRRLFSLAALSLVAVMLLMLPAFSRNCEAAGDSEQPESELLTDDDGDGIIHYKFFYKGATVYALIVLDPSRVFVGTALPQPSDWGGYGLTLDAMTEQYGAVAGINAGGFLDEGGAGNGWPPSGITFSRGITFSTVQYGPVAGLDENDHMWSGFYDYEECRDAVVMMVVDGRQGYSIGVTFEDCVNIMADKFGCVNASNMDGGNSSCMYFGGRVINRSANQAGGTRYLPDAWLVSPLPDQYVKPAAVPDHVLLPDNSLGEKKDYQSACDPETADSLFAFVCSFAERYYGYFGSKNADYWYPYLLRYAAPDSDLRYRADLALLDRMWVNTWGTDVTNITLKGAWDNGDGTYDVIIASDIYEHADYWNFEALNTELRITLYEDPDAYYGYLVTETY